MTLNIRNPEAVVLARWLAQLDQTCISDAVVSALREAIQKRVMQESPTATAGRLLEKRGLTFAPDRKLVPESAWYDLDHDLREGD